MQRKLILLRTVTVGVCVAFIVFRGLAFSGNLEPGGPPSPTMHTLEDIYQAVIGGESGSGGNLEPSGPLAPTMHTLEDIYQAVISSAPVEKTGQATSYNSRDDGDLKNGVTWPTPRFAKNGDGTVTDNLTGLIWMKDAGYFNRMEWPSALNACHFLKNGTAGLTDSSAVGDWHLPNVKELQSLVHYGFINPSLPNTAGTGRWSHGEPFDDMRTFYWSSTTHGNSTSRAWRVVFHYGEMHALVKSAMADVWCVRGGQ